MKICIIVNPGSRDGEDLLGTLNLEEIDLDATVRATEHEGQAVEIAGEAAIAGFDTVVAAGGDGTINEVVNGLADHLDEVTLGILPLGTGNDLARTLGLGDDLDDALRIIATGHAEACDLVRVTSESGERLMVNVSAGGFSGAVGETLTSEMKRAWGPFAYLRAAFESLADRQEYELRIAFDDREELELQVANVVVANGRHVAAGVPVAPHADLTDGRVDVLVIRGGSVVELAGLGPKILAGSHLEDEDERLLYRQVERLSLAAEPEMPLNVDGELIGSSPARFDVLPRALEVLVDPERFPADDR